MNLKVGSSEYRKYLVSETLLQRNSKVIFLHLVVFSMKTSCLKTCDRWLVSCFVNRGFKLHVSNQPYWQ